MGDIKLLAISGPNAEGAPAVNDAGVDSTCVFTDLLLNENPQNRLPNWLAPSGQLS
ncbi:MAG: hypothetical protein MK188_12235 [Gammaproteobacteria bacterium]|nr:hypothetical protein [Gammaproteobacteria bacterium]